jgi:glycosyltransferase involved in cell wall biosynthesis
VFAEMKLTAFPPAAGTVDVAIVTGASLAWNPRAFREAAALSATGLRVVVLGASAHSALKLDQDLASQHGFAFLSVVADGRTIRARLRSRAARAVFRTMGVQSCWQLGQCIKELLAAAEEVGAKYHIMHLEQGLWVGMKLLEKGYRVGVDFEDWYSEDLLPEARRTRPVRMLRALERTLLREAEHTACPSFAMSRALAREFACAQPMVIHNACPWSARNLIDRSIKDRRDGRRPSIHWFSQTMGLGRGLEDLVAALPQVSHDVEIHLRGRMIAGFDRWVRARLPEYWQDRVFFHPTVTNEELLSRIAEHDIGFAGEMKYSKSRDLTVTNKILQYLLAGLAVVASDTQGQTEVGERAPQAVSLYPSGDAGQLAERLNALVAYPDKLRAAKAAALQAAEGIFCWERQERTLVQSVERALSASVR